MKKSKITKMNAKVSDLYCRWYWLGSYYDALKHVLKKEHKMRDYEKYEKELHKIRTWGICLDCN